MTKKYMLFTTPTCIACPPVKSFIAELESRGLVNGERIDVGEEQGLERAIQYGISQSPTVILFDEQQQEIGRAHNVQEIKSIIFDY